jgi:hypothetical protein
MNLALYFSALLSAAGFILYNHLDETIDLPLDLGTVPHSVLHDGLVFIQHGIFQTCNLLASSNKEGSVSLISLTNAT